MEATINFLLDHPWAPAALVIGACVALGAFIVDGSRALRQMAEREDGVDW